MCLQLQMISWPRKKRPRKREEMEMVVLRIDLLSGGILDCTAFGVPPPQITWLRLLNSNSIKTSKDLLSSKELEANGALWQVLPHNNSLKFRPYSPSEYNPEIHKASYVCRASSESGTVLSRAVHVKSGKIIFDF